MSSNRKDLVVLMELDGKDCLTYFTAGQMEQIIESLKSFTLISGYNTSNCCKERWPSLRWRSLTSLRLGESVATKQEGLIEAGGDLEERLA